jgi:CheY-like chemotaxis protein
MLPTAPIRVLIADDIPELRTLLRTTLQGRGFQLVGEAGDGRETLALAVDREPDVVVLDLGMPGVDGSDLVAELRQRAPAVRVVALSAFAAEAQRRRALDLGAHASLDKDVDPDQLVATLREVCGRAFGPVALPPPGGLDGLAGEELERVWSTLAAAPVATAVVGPGRPLPQGQPGPVRARRPPRARPAGRRLPGGGPPRGPGRRHRAAPAPARR